MAHTKKDLKKEGEFLRYLYEWSGKPSIAEFAKPFKRHRNWVTTAFDDEIIPVKDKIAICKAYNIPLEYFKGTFELPIRGGLLNDPEHVYGSTADLLNEVQILRKDLIERDKEVISLQKKLIELMEKLNS